MATLNNLLSNQMSTQLGSLAAPVQPGAAMANIVGGLGKMYAQGEQMKLANLLQQQEQQREQDLIQQKMNQQMDLAQMKIDADTQQRKNSAYRNAVMQANEKTEMFNRTVGFENDQQKSAYFNDVLKQGLTGLEGYQENPFSLATIDKPTPTQPTMEPISDLSSSLGQRVKEKQKSKKTQSEFKTQSEQLDVYGKVKEQLGEGFDGLENQIRDFQSMISSSSNVGDIRGYAGLLTTINKYAPGFLPQGWENQASSIEEYDILLKNAVRKNAKFFDSRLSDADIKLLKESFAKADTPEEVRNVILNGFVIGLREKMFVKNYYYDVFMNDRSRFLAQGPEAIKAEAYRELDKNPVYSVTYVKGPDGNQTAVFDYKADRVVDRNQVVNAIRTRYPNASEQYVQKTADELVADGNNKLRLYR